MARKPPVKKALRYFLSALFFLLTQAAAADVSTLDLPDMGDSTGTFFSPAYEKRLGQAFLNQVRRTSHIVEDPEVESYIRSLGYRLVSHSDDNTKQFTFFVVKDPQINAFAAPGGIVGINSGTITHTATESELAGVMAHEISHVTQKHLARSIEKQQQMSIPMMAAMLGAILIATQNPNAGQAAMAAIQGGAIQSQINFTRSNEEEADRVGEQLLARSGLNPEGMPDFFEKLLRNSRYAADAPEFLRDHPLTTNRIADSRARADAYPHKNHYDESRLYRYVRAKLIVGSYDNPSDAVNFYSAKLNDGRIHDDGPILRYGLALAMTRAGDYGQARALLDGLLKRDPDNTSLLLASANLERQQGNYDTAIGIYEHMQKLYPRYRPLVFSYVDTLLAAKQPDKALKVLKGYGKVNDPDIKYYNYLARAEAESGNPIESSIAHAEYYYLTGETRLAIQQLRYLLRQPKPRPDYYQEERIRARIADMEQELDIEKDMHLTKGGELGVRSKY
jgi:predicted Zn-dependent protease